MVVNAASRRVMEKCGLTLVRTFHQEWPYHIEGDEHGDVEYALTRADWERHGELARTRVSERRVLPLFKGGGGRTG